MTMKKKKRLLLATLCDQRITVDDCSHRATYKFYASGDGVEIEYRHVTIYCTPWATKEQRKPGIEKKSGKCSESLSGALEHLLCGAFPVKPCPPIDEEFYSDMSLKFGEGASNVVFSWSFENPPTEWRPLDEFARATINEIYEWYTM